MKPYAILARFAIAATLGLACASPALAGKWTLVDNVLTYVDDAAEGAKRLDGGVNDAANAVRKLDDDDLPNDGGKRVLRAGDKVDNGAGGLAARAPITYDQFIPEGAVDAAKAGKNVPTAVLQVDNAADASGAVRKLDPKDWDNLPNMQFNPLAVLRNNANNAAAAPPTSNYLIFDPKLIKPGEFADANLLPSVSNLPFPTTTFIPPTNTPVVNVTPIVRNADDVAAQADNAAAQADNAAANSSDVLRNNAGDAAAKSNDEFNDFLNDARQRQDDVLARGDRELDNILDANRRAFNETPAPRLEAPVPKTAVKVAKQGPGWSTRKKVIVGSSVTGATLVVGGAVTYVVYSTYAPATEKLDVFADAVRDVAAEVAKLKISNFTDDTVEVFETLFNSRTSLATLTAQERDKEITVKIGDKIEIVRNGAPFTSFSMVQDEDISVQ